ncbi:hypothetical protein Tco_0483438 [Tanacetum coccineum]
MSMDDISSISFIINEAKTDSLKDLKQTKLTWGVYCEVGQESQDKGKAPMIIEEAFKKTKEQILQEEASLAEAIRLDTLEKEEEAKQEVATRRSDFAKKMVELVNQRKKHFAEERARAKRNKPMTQSQLRTYIRMKYLKESGDMESLYGMTGPEDEFEKVLWEYLKNMFEEPLSTDPIWSLLGQSRNISWNIIDTCRVHCLNLESMDLYMLIERKYPLSAEVCKAMLEKKLQGGKPDENCYINDE